MEIVIQTALLHLSLLRECPWTKRGLPESVQQHLKNADRKANFGVICMQALVSVETSQCLQYHPS